MLLVVQNLSKAFGGVRAVDDVSWSIDTGQMRCIIGPNGAGKSTFFQLLIGRTRADSGRIWFKGMDITRAEPFERAKLGIAVKPQTLGVFTELSVDLNLRLAHQRKASGACLEERIEQQLAELRLADKRDYLVRELSHGEKQWLALGMALALKPDLLLLDEPTAGMSPAETAETVAIIQRTASERIAVVAVEHDMAFVRNLGADITVFHNGAIFASGSLAEIEHHDDVRRLYLGTKRLGAVRQRADDAARTRAAPAP
jgi:branched-chain amino acid transport system ATP-binding protein